MAHSQVMFTLWDSSLMQILMKCKLDGRKRNLFISLCFNSSLKNRFLFFEYKNQMFFFLSIHVTMVSVMSVPPSPCHECRHQLCLNVKHSKCHLSVHNFSKSKCQRPVRYGLIRLHKTFCIY